MLKRREFLKVAGKPQPCCSPGLAASASQRRSNGTAMGYEGCLTDNYSCITVLLTGSLLLRLDRRSILNSFPKT